MSLRRATRTTRTTVPFAMAALCALTLGACKSAGGPAGGADPARGLVENRSPEDPDAARPDPDADKSLTVTGRLTLSPLDGPHADLLAFCAEHGDDETMESPDCSEHRTGALNAKQPVAGIVEVRWYKLENTAMGEQVQLGVRTSAGWYFQLLTNGTTHEWAEVTVDGVRSLAVGQAIGQAIGPTLVLNVRLNYDHRAVNTYWTGKVLCALADGVPHCSSRLDFEYESHDLTDEDGAVDSESVSRTMTITDAGLVMVESDEVIGAESEDPQVMASGVYQLVFAAPQGDDDG